MTLITLSSDENEALVSLILAHLYSSDGTEISQLIGSGETNIEMLFNKHYKKEITQDFLVNSMKNFLKDKNILNSKIVNTRDPILTVARGLDIDAQEYFTLVETNPNFVRGTNILNKVNEELKGTSFREIPNTRSSNIEVLLSKAITTSMVSGSLSFIFNIKSLCEGKLQDFSTRIATDIGLSIGTSSIGTILKDVPIINKGPGVILFGAYDAFCAIKTGDWQKLYRNIGVNSVSTIGSECGAYYGGFYGACLGGPVGLSIGYIVGGLTGGVCGHLTATNTFLGYLTDYEKIQKMNEIRIKYNPELEPKGVQIDPQVGYDEFCKLLKEGKIKCIPCEIYSNVETKLSDLLNYLNSKLSEL